MCVRKIVAQIAVVHVLTVVGVVIADVEDAMVIVVVAVLVPPIQEE